MKPPVKNAFRRQNSLRGEFFPFLAPFKYPRLKCFKYFVNYQVVSNSFAILSDTACQAFPSHRFPRSLSKFVSMASTCQRPNHLISFEDTAGQSLLRSSVRPYGENQLPLSTSPAYLSTRLRFEQSHLDMVTEEGWAGLN